MDADQLIFTSGGTESNNLALAGLQRTGGMNPPAHGVSSPPALVISAIEHPSIARTAESRTHDR